MQTDFDMQLGYKWMSSPVGPLKLVAGDEGLVAVLWAQDDPRRVRLPALHQAPAHRVLCQAEQELDDYFAGRRQAFSVPLAFNGSAFQKRVWTRLLAIPFGETRTYGQLAAELGDPKASRAVGAANGRNPISIIAPCHRVVGANGQLTGFAGGLDAKAALLRLEAAQKLDAPVLQGA